MQVFPLINETNAYKVFSKDIENSTLSHAYLIVCDDSFMLENYVKVFVKALMCDATPYCDNCRTCRLIDKKTLTDVKFYPTDKKIKVADVDEIISSSRVKPLESDKKVFVLLNAEDMNLQSQNKLLKTLEEPPENVYLILGATTVYPLLSTVLSRVKRLDIPPFSDEKLTSFFNKNGEYEEDKLAFSISLANGKVGEVLKRYEEETQNVEDLCYDILSNLKSSRDAYRFSNKITKENYRDVLSSMLRIVNNLIKQKSGVEIVTSKESYKKAQEIANLYTYGALIYMFEKFTEIEKRVNFNLNLNAVIDGILFGILEGKHKWQKL